MSDPSGVIMRLPIVQTTGSGVKKLMSQNAITTELSKLVPLTRKINGKSLSGNITLVPGDLGAYTKSEVEQLISDALANAGGGGGSEIRVKEWMRGVNPVGGGYAFIGTDGKAYASVRGFAGNNRALAPGRRSENESNIGLHEILAGPGEIGAVGFIGQYTGYVWNKTTADILTWGRNEYGQLMVDSEWVTEVVDVRSAVTC